MSANVTIATTPSFLEPINTDGLYFSFTTTNPTLANFRYYAETFYVDKTTLAKTSVGRVKVVADRNGVGAFSPHSILKSYIKSSLNYTALGSAQPPQTEDSLVAYTVKSGVGYNPKAQYGTSSTSGISRGATIPISEFTAGRVFKPASFPTPTSGTYYYVRLDATLGHGWLVGDEITISKNNKGINPYYDGKAVVVGTGTLYVDLNILYSSTPYVTGGSIGTGTTPTYVESGDIIDVVSMRSESQILYTWNAVKQYENQGKNWFQRFSLVSNTSFTPGPTAPYFNSVMTNYNFKANFKSIYLNQYETQMFMMWETGTVNYIKIKTYNAAMTVINTYYKSMTNIATNPKMHMWTLPTGTKNWQGVTATSGGTITFATAKYYTIEVGTTNVPTLPLVENWSEPVRYKIVDANCVYDNVRIAYLNKAGGYDFVNFSQAMNKSQTIARKEIQKTLPYNYVIGDRATNILSTDITETFTANTDFISEHDYLVFTELFTSPDVYWLKTDGTIELKIPIIVTDTSYKYQNRMRDKIFSITVNFKLASKTIAQNL